MRPSRQLLAEPQPRPENTLRFEDPSTYGAVPVAEPNESAGEVWVRLRGGRFASASHVVVCSRGRFEGLARIEAVLAAPSGTPMRQVMDDDPPVIQPDMDEEVAAWKAVRHGESALAVVDPAGAFVGLITPRRIVEVLLREHDEDLARLGGYLASTATARHAMEEAVPRRLLHRLPWLLFGLLGALLAAGVVGAYEEDLQANVLLALFVPGIVYLADAVGTQTETLVIRGLSVGVPIGRIVRRELLTGLIVGLVLAAAFVPVGLFVWHDQEVVAAVAIALLAASSVATLVAMSLPWLFSRLRVDPAFGSGPMATVIQDLLSLVIYLMVAGVLVS